MSLQDIIKSDNGYQNIACRLRICSAAGFASNAESNVIYGGNGHGRGVILAILCAPGKRR